MSRRALLVIDVQNDYIDGPFRITYPAVNDSLPKIAAAMDAATAHGIPVVVVQHSSTMDSPIFRPGSHGWENHPTVASRPSQLQIEKKLASALAGTGLDDWLREREIDTLTLVGYMTHNCIDSTARDAAHRGYQVEVLSDATGSLPYAHERGQADGQTLHQATLTVLHTAFALVLPQAEWQAALEGAPLPARSNVFSANQAALALQLA